MNKYQTLGLAGLVPILIASYELGDRY
ncbi:hypothetical protein F383_30726 [Gossypium arboreum]|uniref:Uncharacterized protein n=1 Tax=Gossypium arboreum TaxID=29729 RepID=A0A0B0PJ04_GOSAR|nr:hypothetical protein F383_30726 [Gossypium arboreum]